jgi:hypothetical protein
METNLMFIICTQHANGSLTADIPPYVHSSLIAATIEAERLAAIPSGKKFVVFQAISITKRTPNPVETTKITY